MSWLFASDTNTITAMQEMHSESCRNDQILPEGVILLGVLRAIESALHRRGLLGCDIDQAMPLWFLAETERNVFLWRNGKSIDNCEEFSFWVDLPRLIAKRRSHLLRCTGFNPFICSSQSESGAEQELRYLDRIEDLDPSIFTKAALVSRASESLREELQPLRDCCQRVILPWRH